MSEIMMKFRVIPFLLSITVLSIAANAASPTASEMLSSAKSKGKLVADDYLSRNILPNSSSFNYFDACSYYGACMYDAAIKDSSFYKSIYTKYKNNKPAAIPTGDVDKNSNGLLPLYLGIIAKDSSLLKLGKAAADNSLEHDGYPRTAIDDTYMTGALMVQAYRATGDLKYLDFFADYFLTYMEKLQQDSGLYWHKLDSKNYWGRGNGWGAAGATELLQVLPTTHSKYTAVLEGYKKQMAGLLTVQKASGIWMQLLGSKDSKNWEETSGSAMFLFAMFTGLRNKWLDEATYLAPATKGWTALTGYLQGSKLTNVAAGFWPSTGTANDYLNASRGQPGDSHGTAAFLWASTAVILYYSQPPVSINQRNAFQIKSPNVNISKTNSFFDLCGRTIHINKVNRAQIEQPAGIYLEHNAYMSKKILTIE